MNAEKTLREWLREAPFALGMSSGFFGFFAHCGVLTVLEEEGLLPSRVAGSSAGALVTGAWAAGLSAHDLARELLRLRREDFWDPSPGLGLLAGRLFRARLEALLPIDDLAKTRVPAAVSVYDVARRRVRVLTSGPIAPALHASCAVPFMFHPVLHAGGVLIDGGVRDRPGLAGLADAERVLFHHLASRSPWRRRNSEALVIPRRPGLVPLVIDDLPRVGPFKLHEGARAFDVARRAARAALDLPIPTASSPARRPNAARRGSITDAAIDGHRGERAEAEEPHLGDEEGGAHGEGHGVTPLSAGLTAGRRARAGRACSRRPW